MYSKEWTQKTISTIRFFDDAFEELEETVTNIDLSPKSSGTLLITVKRLLQEREKLDE